MKSSRRQFLAQCSTATAALAGARLGFLGFARAGDTSPNRETLIVVFLRGGMDGLSLIPPIDGPDRGHYQTARPNIQVPLTGANAALALNAQFGMNPATPGLRDLFQAGKLAIIQAVGSSGSRSHFDAQKFLELGTPGIKATTDGWLTRHLASSPALPADIVMPVLAAGYTPPTSLLGCSEVVNMVDAGTFSLSQIGHTSWASGDMWEVLRRIFALDDTFLRQPGIQAMNAAGLVESYVQSTYTPVGNAQYPAGDFGQALRMLAQLVKSDIGLRVATVDLGNWDTHEFLGLQSGGRFWKLAEQLSQGLTAFYSDLNTSATDAPINRVTIVAVSEFGRRVRENANQGNDHGTGNPVLVLGGNVRGGFYGNWPGLHPDQLFDSADLAPTTDLRRVLSEILIRRTGNPRLGEVFPKYADYSPLNIVTGPDLAPDYSFAIPVTPADFAARRLGDTVVRLTWSRAVHASNYRVERRSSPDAPWEYLASLGSDTVRYDDTAAPTQGTPGYRLQAFNSHGDGAFVEVAVTAGSDPVGQWRLKYFGTAANAGAAANDAVAAGDGLPNYVKYALGLDPLPPAQLSTQGFTPGRPRIEVGATSAALVFVRPVDRLDVRYDVVTSTDLTTWSLVAQVSEGTQNGFERLRASIASPNPRAQFLKLTVQPA